MQKAGTGGERGIAGRRIYYRNWLYHVDCYAAPGSVFSGLTGSGAPGSERDCGILDMELWGDVYPSCYIADAEKPDFTHAAAFGTGLLTENRTLSALVLGEYAYGKGRIVVNTFRILDNLGRSPLADRLAEKLIGRYR